VFENRVLGIAVGPTREDVIGAERNVHNNEIICTLHRI
jgi:hypothetical protein